MSETAPKRAESTAMQHYIDSLETVERIKHYPHLTERAPNVEIDDVATADDEGNGDDVVSVRNQGLQSFSGRLRNHVFRDRRLGRCASGPVSEDAGRGPLSDAEGQLDGAALA